MLVERRQLISIAALSLFWLAPLTGLGQSQPVRLSVHAAEVQLGELSSNEALLIPKPLRQQGIEEAVQQGSVAESDNSQGGFRVRQALLLSGAAVSMLAYGIFALQFNNTRKDAENARLAYEEDVSENAQYYVDEGIELDQIPAYYAWEEAYSDASSARELLTIAGVSAFLLSVGAILDSATSGKRKGNELSTHEVRPILRVSPSRRDVVVGARVGL